MICKSNISLFAQSSYGDTSLEDCLQIFTKKEILDGDEQPVSRLYYVYFINQNMLKCSALNDIMVEKSSLKTLKSYLTG